MHQAEKTRVVQSSEQGSRTKDKEKRKIHKETVIIISEKTFDKTTRRRVRTNHLIPAIHYPRPLHRRPQRPSICKGTPTV